MTTDTTTLSAAAGAGPPPATTAPTVQLPVAEALGLITSLGLHPTDPSPLAMVTVEPADPGPPTRRSLFDAGWLEHGESPRLTERGRRAVELLAAPHRRIDLLLGTGTWWFEWSGLTDGSATAPLLAVAPGSDPATLGLTIPSPPRLALDLLAAHLRVGRIERTVGFEADLSPAALTCWWGVLDDLTAARLQATLDRSTTPRDRFDADHVYDAVLEGRTVTHLAWQLAVAATARPDSLVHLEHDDVATALRELEVAGLVAADGDQMRLTPIGREIAAGVSPVARWAGMTLLDRADTSESADLRIEQLAIRRGVTAMTAERRSQHRPGGTVLRTIDDADLEGLLLALLHGPAADRPTEPPPVFCNACGVRLRPTARFCQECGHRAEVIP